MAQDNDAVVKGGCQDGGGDGDRNKKEDDAQSQHPWGVLVGHVDDGIGGDDRKEHERIEQRAMRAEERGQPAIPPLKRWARGCGRC